MNRVDPDEIGFDPDRLAVVEKYLDEEIGADRMPGAVLGIVRGGRLGYLAAFGHRDKAAGVPMTTDSLFWLASMTKPVTTVGALLLAERGLLRLDAEIGEYLPGFTDRRVADSDGNATVIPTRQPSILDLLRHTAGIPEGMLGDSAVHAQYVDAVGDGMTDLTGEQFAERLSRLPLLHEPGAVWHYGWGLDLTGLIIESLVGQPLRTYLREQVLDPLGMPDAGFGLAPDQQERYARPLDRDPLTGAAQSLPDLGRARFDSGGAGLVGTAGDYLRFVGLLLGGGAVDGTRILGRKTVEHMTADHLDSTVDVRRLHRPGWSPGHGFGLGLAVRRQVGGASSPGSVGELTWPGAAGTTWWADPREDLGVVFLTHTPSRIQARYQQQVKTMVLAALR